MGCIIIILSFFHVIFYYRHYLFKALSAYAFDIAEPNFKLGKIPCIPLLAEQLITVFEDKPCKLRTVHVLDPLVCIPIHYLVLYHKFSLLYQPKVLTSPKR